MPAVLAGRTAPGPKGAGPVGCGFDAAGLVVVGAERQLPGGGRGVAEVARAQGADPGPLQPQGHPLAVAEVELETARRPNLYARWTERDGLILAGPSHLGAVGAPVLRLALVWVCLQRSVVWIPDFIPWVPGGCHLTAARTRSR
ncbi:hypothetical protein ABID95_004216 [Streptomyces atratus]|uniref:hypothetical protein n=1 Tax=Streptomyces TaxID=1883 RepID=UPI000E306B1B|nr:hypothetical protein [Streptomyces sp. AcE210]RFC78200.1 hypothetical protein DXZ75_10825 [Streptomyces sp. AcE210]